MEVQDRRKMLKGDLAERAQPIATGTDSDSDDVLDQVISTQSDIVSSVVSCQLGKGIDDRPKDYAWISKDGSVCLLGCMCQILNTRFVHGISHESRIFFLLLQLHSSSF